MPPLKWMLGFYFYSVIGLCTNLFCPLRLFSQLLFAGSGARWKNLFASFSARTFPNWHSLQREIFQMLVEAGLSLYPLRYHVSLSYMPACGRRESRSQCPQTFHGEEVPLSRHGRRETEGLPLHGCNFSHFKDLHLV